MKSLDYEVSYYRTENGNVPFLHWIEKLRSEVVRARIIKRLERLPDGNFGDCKPLKNTGGIYELRLSFCPGFRVYYGIRGNALVVILCGGDKSSQDIDIRKAKKYWKDYLERQT